MASSQRFINCDMSSASESSGLNLIALSVASGAILYISSRSLRSGGKDRKKQIEKKINFDKSSTRCDLSSLYAPFEGNGVTYSVPLKFDESCDAYFERLDRPFKEKFSGDVTTSHSFEGRPARGNRPRSVSFHASEMETPQLPGLEGMSSCDSSSTSSSSSLVGEDEAAAYSSVVPKGPRRRSCSVSFDDSVFVLPIPKFDDYPASIRRRLWGNSKELHENAIRNSIEFASEGWDWRTVTLEEAMYVCKASGELIHPVHCKSLDPDLVGLILRCSGTFEERSRPS